MAKLRIYELAKELQVDHRDLVRRVQSMGIDIKGVMSTLDDDEVTRIRAHCLNDPLPASEGSGTFIHHTETPTQTPPVSQLPEGIRRFRTGLAAKLQEAAVKNAAEKDGTRMGSEPPVPDPEILLRRTASGTIDVTHDRSLLADLFSGLVAKPSTPSAPVLATPEAIQRCLSRSGLEYTETTVRRFLLASLAARESGTMLLIAGPTGTGKTRIVREMSRLLNGAGDSIIPVRPEWLGSSDLLGYVDPIRALFAPTDFVTAVRRATSYEAAASGDPDEPRLTAPYFLLLDELNLARVENFGADLLAVNERGPTDDQRELLLFPEDLRDGWLAELGALQSADQVGLRRTTLERFFHQETHKQAHRNDPHRLRLPSNLLVCGTLNTDRHTHELSPKVFDRSFVMRTPPPSVALVFGERNEYDTSTAVDRAFILPRVKPRGADVFKVFPNVRDHFIQGVEALASCGIEPSFRLRRGVVSYLRQAAYWYKQDGSDDPCGLAGDLIHLLLLPRIDCSANQAKQGLDKLRSATATWSRANDALKSEIAELLDRATCSSHGGFRGLK
jgi:energy-coupling factor transporter ATP-binding protein EcfA2